MVRANQMIFFLTFFLAVMAGCVLHEQPALNSRYFGDYTGFQKVDFTAETVVYRHPTTRVIDYDKFLVEPVSVYENPQKKLPRGSASLYDELALDLHDKLVKLV